MPSWFSFKFFDSVVMAIEVCVFWWKGNFTRHNKVIDPFIRAITKWQGITMGTFEKNMSSNWAQSQLQTQWHTGASHEELPRFGIQATWEDSCKWMLMGDVQGLDQHSECRRLDATPWNQGGVGGNMMSQTLTTEIFDGLRIQTPLARNSWWLNDQVNNPPAKRWN